MSYGVQPSGFVLKRLPEILAEIETAARGIFGSGVIQTAQSPLGQLNGLCSELIARTWEMAEGTYQSNDPDQAEGVNLDRLARLRVLSRSGAGDETFRRTITNKDRSRLETADLLAEVRGVVGVTFADAVVNDSAARTPDGVPPQHIAVAALGGADAAIGAAIRSKLVPGIATFGNAVTEVVVDGLVRPIRFVRPAPISLWLRVLVKESSVRRTVEPPTQVAIRDALIAGLTGVNELVNGEDLTEHHLTLALAKALPGVELVQATAHRGTNVWGALPHPIAFTELARFDAARITALYA